MADDQKPQKGNDDQPDLKQVGPRAETRAVEDKPKPKLPGDRDASHLKRKLADEAASPARDASTTPATRSSSSRREKSPGKTAEVTATQALSV